MKRLLIPLDGSDLAQRAVPVAANMARRGGGELVLMHAHWPGLPLPASDGLLRNTAWALRDQGVCADTRTRVTPRDQETGRVILDAAEDCGADMVVMASHGRGGLGRFFFGSVAEQVLTSARIPVLLVPASIPSHWPGRDANTVVLAVDASATAERAIDPTVAMADMLGADLVLVRVIQSADPISVRAVEELSQAERTLRALADRLSAGGRPVRHEVRFGDPDRAIAELVREVGAVALGIGASGEGRRRGPGLGSVALGTLRRSDVPVLLVPPVDRIGVMPLELMVTSAPLRPPPLAAIPV